MYCDRVTSMNSWSYTAVALKSGAGSPTSLPSAAQRSALAPLAGRAATVRALAGAQARERRDELASIVSDLVTTVSLSCKIYSKNHALRWSGRITWQMLIYEIYLKGSPCFLGCPWQNRSNCTWPLWPGPGARMRT